MATSTALGLILGLPPASTLGDIPARTSTLQSACNNANHVADERSRVLVNYPWRSTTTGGRTVSKVGAWDLLYRFGPFPLLADSEDGSYSVRVRVGGRSATGASCTLRIGVCPVGRADGLMAATVAVGPVLESAAFTATTNAWRAEGVLRLSGSAFGALTPVATVDAVSSASPVSVGQLLATIEVWGLGTDCIAGGAYAAEQVTL